MCARRCAAADGRRAQSKLTSSDKPVLTVAAIQAEFSKFEKRFKVLSTRPKKRAKPTPKSKGKDDKTSKAKETKETKPETDEDDN